MLKRDVLRDKRDFSRIYSRGKSVGERYVVLFYMKNGLDCSRRAFLASKKVGNSVQRNRARRLMRESYREISRKIPAGYDIIMIARKSINEKKFQEVDASLRRAFRKSGLWR